MSAPPVVSVDYSGRRAPLTLAGTVLLLAGALATTVAWIGYRQLEASRAGLELKLAEVRRSTHRDPALDLRNTSLTVETGKIAQELTTPWTPLLAELEAVSQNSGSDIALLSVEPDESKHIVRVTGESRDLTKVLAYVGRLQSSALLRYPMLENHEVRGDDPQRPVRFAVSAEWRQP